MHIFLIWRIGFWREKVVSEQIDKVAFGKQLTHKDSSEQSVAFVATCHPKLKDLGKMIKNLQFFLYSDNEVWRVFSPAPIASSQSARKIKDYIVRSKLYPIERKVGSYRCSNPRCQACTSMQVTDTFSSFATKSVYKINCNFNCNSKCLIYLLSCKTCGKQYTSKTIDKFRSRQNNYKTDARKAAIGNKESCKQQSLQNHFLQDDHQWFLEDVEVTLIDKTQTSDPIKREYYWKRTLKILCPDGLNLESDYLFLAFVFMPLTYSLFGQVFNSRFLSMVLGAWYTFFEWWRCWTTLILYLLVLDGFV